MAGGPRSAVFRWRNKRRLWTWALVIGSFFIIRISKGAGFADVYSLLIRPFWPGSTQKEWIQSSVLLEDQIKLQLLEEDNIRLRKILKLKSSANSELLSAVVISRNTRGWWHQLQLSKGSLKGIHPGDAVIGPGGLIGMVQSITPLTSRVRLLTAPGSRIGVWVPRVKRHGILLGLGTNKPQLRFFDKDSQIMPGDVVSTSPASTLVPPNLPVGVIQSFEAKALPAPTASVQLIASPEAIDWVQIQKL